uniref:NADH-ubiquinone oxidoreductase chain 2 n=1 Tax=Cladolidia biungulata TaxID=2983421 RepID=A0A977TLF6_9HEMI|nr:NADH dehydrogenase subunit 2 [Cladolidia biungulata]UXW93594.1 NADH dehydrogenase subunit 2 [Cladolidia biungulata]
MKLNSTILLFKTMIIMGMLISLSSSNWIMLWSGLELMLMSFIPIMNSMNMMYTESAMKYFIMQSISSALLMMSILTSLTMLDNKMLMTTAMLIKLAIAPMNMWFISTMEGVSTNMLMTMLITMKIIPMVVMSYMNLKINTMIIMSLLISALLIINQTSMKKIIGHSSVFNFTLMLSMVSISSMWMSYLLIYSMLTWSMINMMKTIKIKSINQLMITEQSKIIKLNMWFLMLSFMGMPPLLGFMNKLMVFELMLSMKDYTMLLMMISSSMMIAFTYMRLSYSSMIMMSMKTKWTSLIHKKKMKITWINTINLVSIMYLI